MPRPRILITRNIDQAAIDRIKAHADVEIWEKDAPPQHQYILDRMPEIQGLLTLLTDPIDAQIIDAASSQFKVISQMAVGFDNIDTQRATARGIPVGHTPGILTETCADFTWALLLAAARRVAEADHQVHQNIWKPWGPDILTGPDVNGATLGIVGLGRIGQAVARRAYGFNMHILYNDPTQNPELEQTLGLKYINLKELLNRSDFVTIHTYLSEETYHLFDRSLFAEMKPNAILLNTSRGPVVDPDGLLWALREKKIGGAALDVFEPEPIPSDHPLLNMPNVIITPHIASASIQTRVKMASMAAENLIAGLNGEKLPYCANTEIYS